MGPIAYPETSVNNHRSTLRNITEERISHLHRGTTLKTNIVLLKSQLLKKFPDFCGKEILINPLNAELNPICHLLTLLGGATIVVVGRLRVKRCML
jgi:hypothetical protein